MGCGEYSSAWRHATPGARRAATGTGGRGTVWGALAGRVGSAGGAVIVRGRVPAVDQMQASSAFESPDQSSGSNAVVLGVADEVYSLRVAPAVAGSVLTRRKIERVPWPAARRIQDGR